MSPKRSKGTAPQKASAEPKAGTADRIATGPSKRRTAVSRPKSKAAPLRHLWLLFLGLIIVLPFVFLPLKKPTIVENENLVKVGFEDLPGFDKDRLEEVIPVFYDAFCKSKPKFLITPESHKSACDRFRRNPPKTGAQFRKYLTAHFSPYKVCDGKSCKGTFTGYYSPLLDGSTVKTSRFNVPLFKVPTTLIKANVKDFVKDCKECPVLYGRIENGRLVPYYTRKEIGTVDPAAKEVLVFVDSIVDAFILHIQGSGKVKLPDGRVMTVGYADNNGHKFTGIGALMKAKGLLEPGKASMPDIKDWLNKNQDLAQELMFENDRFIFFRESDFIKGSLGIELIPGRSLAVDPAYIPLGAVLWLDTVAPDRTPLRRMVFAHDTGAAIKGVIRGDFYWGFGDAAFQQAGRMKSPGEYYILLPK